MLLEKVREGDLLEGLGAKMRVFVKILLIFVMEGGVKTQTTSIQLKVLEITSKSSMIGSWQWGKHLFYFCIFLSILSILCFLNYILFLFVIFVFWAFVFIFSLFIQFLIWFLFSFFISNIDVFLIVCFYTFFECLFVHLFFDYYLCVCTFLFLLCVVHSLFCLFILKF